MSLVQLSYPIRSSLAFPSPINAHPVLGSLLYQALEYIRTRLATRHGRGAATNPNHFVITKIRNLLYFYSQHFVGMGIKIVITFAIEIRITCKFTQNIVFYSQNFRVKEKLDQL